MEKYIKYITTLLPKDHRGRVKFYYNDHVSVARMGMYWGGKCIASQRFYHIVILNGDPPSLSEKKKMMYFWRYRLVLLPPGRNFTIHGSLDECEPFYYLIIKKEIVDEIVKDFYGRSVNLDIIQYNVKAGTADLVCQIEKELMDKTLGYESIVKYQVSLLMAGILRGHELNKKTGSGGINKACEYIAAYFNTNIHTDELARVANMSKFHFIRQFKQLTGSTPYQYIKQFRLKKGHELLLTTNISISQIAKMCGFVSASHFTHDIRNAYEHTPTQLRQKNKR